MIKLFMIFLLLISQPGMAKESLKDSSPDSGKVVGLKEYTKKQAVEILEEAERIRSLDTAEVNVELKTEAGTKKTTYILDILRTTERRALITFVAPKEEIGRKMLAKGRKYWSTFPDSKRVHLISKKEMIGNSVFAIADIFQIDPHEDYDPTVVERIQDNDKKVLLKLFLKQKNTDAPYDSIEYWVEEEGSFPVSAKFYGVSGKHLKTMTVESRKKIAGRDRPFVTKMADEVSTSNVSWWKTEKMVSKNIPDQVFSKQYLKKK